MPKLKKEKLSLLDSEGQPSRDKWNAFTANLGHVYDDAKDFEKKLKKGTDDFKRLATETVEASETLARKTVTLVAASEEEARDLATLYNPRHRIVGGATLSDAEDGADPTEFTFDLEEDPQYLPFVHVNDVEEKTYQKSLQVGSPQVDLERLQANEDDWLAVSELEQIDEAIVIASLIEFLNLKSDDEVANLFNSLGPDALEAWLRLAAKPAERILINEDDWTPEQSTIMQPYLYEGKPVVKFLKPREATDEELDSIEAVD